MDRANGSLAKAVLPSQSAKQIERAHEIQHILAILHQWGIHTVGQLAALKRDDLAIRLGTRAVELWQRVNGRTHRLLKLVSPPESFIESFEFDHEIETVEPLLFILRRFLQQLATRLNAIYLIVKELRLRLVFADKSHYERVFKIPQPTNNEDVLFRMLHTHLENFTAAHPIAAVELQAQPSRSVGKQFGLFETALRNPAQLHETLARLVGLVGADRVGTPALEETHRPDAFWMEPFRWEISHPDWQSRACPERGEAESNGDPAKITSSVTQGRPSTPLRGAQNDAALRPRLRRFRKRTQATVLLEQNEPAHLQTAETAGAIARRDGPFAISGNWWDERSWAQLEWDVEIENGPVLRCHCDDEGWAVDGIYD